MTPLRNHPLVGCVVSEDTTHPNSKPHIGKVVWAAIGDRNQDDKLYVQFSERDRTIWVIYRDDLEAPVRRTAWERLLSDQGLG